jgi:hypothetical protein
LQSEVLYLGHIISREGITVDPSKTDVVKSFPVPKNQHDVRSFFGMYPIAELPASHVKING